MKIIDGTFTLNSGQDSELSEDQKNYVDNLLADIDINEKNSHLKLVEKVINLPIDKQLHVIYAILDNFYTLSSDSQVLEILIEQGKITMPEFNGTVDEYCELVDSFGITEETYPELFEEVEKKNRFFEKFLAQPVFAKFRNFVMDIVDDDNKDADNNDAISKYEKEFGVKIIQSKNKYAI